MKSYIYKAGILNRVYNLIKWDCDRRAVKVMTESNLKIAIDDQLVIEYNGYNFSNEEAEILMTALEGSDFIEFCGCSGEENYFMI